MTNNKIHDIILLEGNKKHYLKRRKSSHMRSKGNKMTYTLKSDRSNRKEVLEAIKKDTAWITEFATECGYEVEFPFWENDSLQLSISKTGRYSPKIYVRNANPILGYDKVCFEIQTTSYGDLTQGEFEEFLGAQKNAFRFASYLNEMSAYELETQFPTLVIEGEDNE